MEWMSEYVSKHAGVLLTRVFRDSTWFLSILRLFWCSAIIVVLGIDCEVMACIRYLIF
jgi:hypothetical protein